jgi:phospholipid/cholesterol/gamma-HCH transport system permease protein
MRDRAQGEDLHSGKGGTVSEQRIRIDRSAAGLCVRLGGSWLISDGLPDHGAFSEALAAQPPRAVLLEGEAVSDWDGALVAWALIAVRLAEAQGATVDCDGLPPGARALLALARETPPRGARPSAPRRGPLAALDATLAAASLEIRETLAFLGAVTLSLGRLARGRAQFSRPEFLELLREVGWDALPVAALVSLLVGAILAFVGAVQLQTLGAQVFVADLVGLAMARDIGAIMTAIVIAGRTGAAYAARIGTMQAAEEIDALRTLALDPVDVLATPRILALLLVTPVLVLYADVLGIVGGAVVGANLPGVTLTGYWARTVEALSMGDVLGGLFKGGVYGVLVAFAGCLRGLQCGRSAAAVGAATTSAVVTGIVYVIAAAALLTLIFHVLEI